MDTYFVRKNLEIIKKELTERLKGQIRQDARIVQQLKIDALDNAIAVQKELKEYGGIKNLIDMAKKGAERSNLFNQPQS